MTAFVPHDAIETTPQLKRGRVWCTVCGHTRKVDMAACFSNGWPTHCGSTMTLDSPEERERLSRE